MLPYNRKDVVVRAADTPARYRPVRVKIGNREEFIRPASLVKGLYVGDMVTWRSDAGLLHHGTVFGFHAGMVKVLLENWGALIGLDQIARVNGVLVAEDMCGGCFQSDYHAEGCPTGQNGPPKYD